ncbi:DUF4190 domain-containing protein [Catellatospora sp. KI3]|uniref:DUF4190 domain-containing protein n=1 Tax=Catellatospora sp. KI3 TaxID=3041620 RepID=UPI00248236BD|nr:DUF4190 domain-containing protein [Catellatospora sp. KI3]MDI1460354.1 DUF4190 domain-containing protein [Catellatospora sp. KI3]
MTNEPVPPHEPVPPVPPPPPPPPPVHPGPSPYGVGPPPAGKDNTVLFGIIGIVAAVACCPPLGILFGWLSMKEARKHGQEETLGKVGFWLGIAFTVLWLLGWILACALGGLGGMMGGHRYDY